MRGVVVIAAIGLLAGALGSTPGLALTAQDKRQVKKIARKVVKKALAKHEQSAHGGGAAGASCPTGTVRYGVGCFEQTARPSTQWQGGGAAKICGDLGRRLPTLSELDGFRQVSGVTLNGPEWSSDTYRDGGVPFAMTMADNGNVSSADTTTLNSYRCVAPLS